MARINSPFVGVARGKLGEGVYTTRFGETIVRAYQPNVFNPRTLGQQDNRVVMASAAKLASVLNSSKYKPFYKPTNNQFYVGAGGNQTVVSYTQFMVSQLRRIPVQNYLFTEVGEGQGLANTSYIVDPDTWATQPNVQRVYWGNGSLTPPVVSEYAINEATATVLNVDFLFTYNFDSPNAPQPDHTFVMAQIINLANGECLTKVSSTVLADLDLANPIVFEFSSNDATDQSGQPFGIFTDKSMLVVIGFVEYDINHFADSSRLYPLLRRPSFSEEWLDAGFNPFGEAALVPSSPEDVLVGGNRPRLLQDVGPTLLADALAARSEAPAEAPTAKRGKKKE